MLQKIQNMGKEKKYVLLIFIIFFVIVLVMHHFMWMYYDDYGYASLSYLGEHDWTIGPDSNNGDMMEFLWYHYMHWAGRPYFIFLVPLLRLGLPAFRIVQSIIILGIAICGYLVVRGKNKKDSPWLAGLVCSIFGLLQAGIMSDGVLWPAASISYIFPLLPALGAVLAIRSNHKILGGFLVLAATWSQEQISVLVMVVLSLVLIWRLVWSKTQIFKRAKELLVNKFNYKEHLSKITPSDIYVWCMGVAGFCLLMFSPGQLSRISDTSDFYQLSFLSKIKQNTPAIMDGTFGGANIFFSLVFVIASLYVIYQNQSMKKLRSISAVWTILVTILLLARFAESPLTTIWGIAAMIIWAVLLIINYAVYFIKANKIGYLILGIGSILSIAMMVMAPYFPYRGALTFWLPVGLIIAFVLYDMLRQKAYIALGQNIATAIFVIALVNSGTIIYGFYQNNAAQQYNDTALKNASQEIRSGNPQKTIMLKKWENTTHGTTPPWTNEFAQSLMKYYYGLPQSVNFTWE